MARPAVNAETISSRLAPSLPSSGQTQLPIEALFQDEANDARSVPIRHHRRATTKFAHCRLVVARRSYEFRHSRGGGQGGGFRRSPTDLLSACVELASTSRQFAFYDQCPRTSGEFRVAGGLNSPCCGWQSGEIRSCYGAVRSKQDQRTCGLHFRAAGVAVIWIDEQPGWSVVTASEGRPPAQAIICTSGSRQCRPRSRAI